MNEQLRTLANLVGGTVKGDSTVMISGLCGIKEAGPGDLTFLANAKYSALIEKTRAAAILVPQGMDVSYKSVIECENPSLAFSKLAGMFMEMTQELPKGVHPTAVIGKNVGIGQDVAIGPYVVIADGVQLGAASVVHALTYIGQGTVLGSHCLVYPHVTIRERIKIGNNVIVHSGTVIGSDGFGFVNVKGSNVKIPQIGTVEIGDDVEIGANVAIDRARFDKTVISSGTKIDNLVQIAHNVRIGENCIIVSQAGISGSTVLEDHVTLAGQAGLVGHITIGRNSVVAAQSGVPNSIPADTIVWGFPAKPINEAKRVNACVQRLPHQYQTVADLKKRIEALEKKIQEIESSAS